jgi:hypothetical protein
MKMHALVLGLLLVAAPALAADVDGKWNGSIDSPNGAVEIGFEFKADGTMLTGTTTNPEGAPTPIKDGKIDGNNITFAVDLDFGGMPFTINYKGVVNAVQGQINLTLDFAGMPVELVVKKAQ